MSHAKRTNKGTIDAKLLTTALENLLTTAQERFGLASTARAKLLAGDENGEITIDKDWIKRCCEIHTDFGAAVAVIHAVKGLQELFDLADPFAEFNDEEENKDAGTDTDTQA